MRPFSVYECSPCSDINLEPDSAHIDFRHLPIRPRSSWVLLCLRSSERHSSGSSRLVPSNSHRFRRVALWSCSHASNDVWPGGGRSCCERGAGDLLCRIGARVANTSATLRVQGGREICLDFLLSFYSIHAVQRRSPFMVDPTSFV